MHIVCWRAPVLLCAALFFSILHGSGACGMHDLVIKTGIVMCRVAGSDADSCGMRAGAEGANPAARLPWCWGVL